MSASDSPHPSSAEVFAEGERNAPGTTVTRPIEVDEPFVLPSALDEWISQDP